MSDVYRSVTNRSLGDNLLESIKSFFVGLLLFVASFPVLWWNEGRLDMSSVAKTAVVVPADASGSAGEGKLIAATADLRTDDQVADPEFLAPAPHLALHRIPEMYAWVEKKETKTEKQLGGGSKEITTYTYDLQWTKSPKSSDSFDHPEGHVNPELGVADKTFYASKGFVGGFDFDPKELGKFSIDNVFGNLPAAKPVAITDAMVKIAAPAPASTPAATASASASAKAGKAPPKVPSKNAAKPVASAVPETPKEPPPPPTKLSGHYLYRGTGTLEQPKLGDVRVSFEAVEPAPAPMTIYGMRQGKTVVEYLHEGNDKLFRVVPGTHEQAIAQIHGEHTTLTWILRGVGFFMMWIGLAMFISPINAVLDIVPFVGSAGRFITGVVMLPIAAGLSIITIVLSIVAHNPLLLIIPAVLLIGIFVLVRVTRKRKTV